MQILQCEQSTRWPQVPVSYRWTTRQRYHLHLYRQRNQGRGLPRVHEQYSVIWRGNVQIDGHLEIWWEWQETRADEVLLFIGQIWKSTWRPSWNMLCNSYETYYHNNCTTTTPTTGPLGIGASLIRDSRLQYNVLPCWFLGMTVKHCKSPTQTKQLYDLKLYKMHVNKTVIIVDFCSLMTFLHNKMYST